MDALISAQAGTALLIEGTKLASIHTHAPEQVIPRRAEEIHLLFGEGLDLQVLEGVDRDQVVRRLALEANSAEALQLSLILLDPEMSEEVRTEAAEELDGLLVEEECREGLERVLYAQPFPSEADPLGALAHSEAHSPRVQEFLRQLVDLQPSIAEVRSAWASLPDTLFVNSVERQRFQAALVRVGLFREFVLTHRAGRSIEAFALLSPDLRMFHGYRSVVQAWAAPFRQHRTIDWLERHGLTLDADNVAPQNAKECLSCGALHLQYAVICNNCGRRLTPAVIPYVLPGKIRFERLLGHGVMGAVYQGLDLGLGRLVAVKILKHPTDAIRLRRDARIAAAIFHRHLAAIYGLETWEGTPLLITELMEGGTLAQRIEKGRFTAHETVDLGIALAKALEHLHAAGILHRDIKPSNIGYTRASVPKLLDFGIAGVFLDLHLDRISEPDNEASVPRPTAIWNLSPASATLSQQLVGTLSYLSPEALTSVAPNTSFDLWGLAVVLYECVLGRKLFAGMDLKLTMARIRQGRIPDYKQTRPDLDAALGQFFRSALHRTLSRRPSTASEMKRRLEEVRGRLTEKPPEMPLHILEP
jgi:hypothetical protein